MRLHGPSSVSQTSGHTGQNPNTVGPALLAEAVAGGDGAPCGDGRALAALTRLMEHDYWSRLWIVQELNLARDVVLRWDGQDISWPGLRRLIASWFQKSASADYILRDCVRKSVNASWKYEGLAIFNFLRHWSGLIPDSDGQLDQSTPGAPLFDLIIRHGSHKCAGPPDHVYALRALATNGNLVTPDYSRPMVSLLSDVVSTDIKHNSFPDLRRTEQIGKLLGITIDDWVDLDIRAKEFRADWASRSPLKHVSVDLFHLCPRCKIGWAGFDGRNFIDGVESCESFFIASLPGCDLHFLLCFNNLSSSVCDMSSGGEALNVAEQKLTWKYSLARMEPSGLVHLMDLLLRVNPEFRYRCDDNQVSMRFPSWVALHQSFKAGWEAHRDWHYFNIFHRPCKSRGP